MLRIFAQPQHSVHSTPNPFSRGTYRVWQRNRDAFLRLWKTELWPPFVEAVMSLLAFGFGLGYYIQQEVEGMSYLRFIGTGMIMSSVMFVACFECSYGAYIRMKMENLFDAMVATPVGVEDVVSGEIMWAATRSCLTGTCVLIVLAVLGLVSSGWVLVVIPLAFLGGFLLASLAMIVTAIVPGISSFNYFITLVVVPMQLFSGVFFPASRLPETVAWLVNISPLYPLMQLARGFYAGRLQPEMIGYFIWVLALSVAFYLAAIVLMRRRMIK